MSTSNAVEVAHSRWADSHPEHDRYSCSDADTCNADPAGSNGCARCTALKLDRANMDAARIAELRAGLIECLRLWPGNRPDYPGNDGSPDLDNADDEALIFLLRESIECVMPDEESEGQKAAAWRDVISEVIDNIGEHCEALEFKDSEYRSPTPKLTGKPAPR